MVSYYPASEIAGNVFVRVSGSCIIDIRVFPEYFNKHVKFAVVSKPTTDGSEKSGVRIQQQQSLPERSKLKLS